MTTRLGYRSVRALGLVPLFVAGVGCSEETTATNAETAVGQAYDALSRKLAECESAKRDCRNASSCSEAELLACDVAFDGCHELAKAEEDELRDAAHACREAKKACQADAADDAAREICRETHEACMKTTRPTEPPCHAELRACLDEARDDDAPDVEAVPPAAEVDDEGAVTDAEGDCVPRPKPVPPTMSDAELACHEQAKACRVDELAANPPPAPPKCGPAPRGEKKPRADAGAPPPPARDDAGLPPPRAELDGGAPVPPADERPRPPKDDAGVRPPPPRPACPPGMMRGPKPPPVRSDAGL